MFSDVLSPEVIVSLIGFIGLLIGYYVTSKKDQNDKALKERELESASWEPLFNKMQEFFQEQLDFQNDKLSEQTKTLKAQEKLLKDQDEKIRKLERDSDLDKRYRQDVDKQIQELRKYLGDSKDVPKIETFAEWYDRIFKGVTNALK